MNRTLDRNARPTIASAAPGTARATDRDDPATVRHESHPPVLPTQWHRDGYPDRLAHDRPNPQPDRHSARQPQRPPRPHTQLS
ncbi:MAG: hypothetical protein ACJ8CR_23975 [Roseiflexaceae bacterium]